MNGGNVLSRLINRTNRRTLIAIVVEAVVIVIAVTVIVLATS